MLTCFDYVCQNLAFRLIVKKRISQICQDALKLPATHVVLCHSLVCNDRLTFDPSEKRLSLQSSVKALLLTSLVTR